MSLIYAEPILTPSPTKNIRFDRGSSSTESSPVSPLKTSRSRTSPSSYSSPEKRRSPVAEDGRHTRTTSISFSPVKVPRNRISPSSYSSPEKRRRSPTEDERTSSSVSFSPVKVAYRYEDISPPQKLETRFDLHLRGSRVDLSVMSPIKGSRLDISVTSPTKEGSKKRGTSQRGSSTSRTSSRGRRTRPEANSSTDSETDVHRLNKDLDKCSRLLGDMLEKDPKSLSKNQKPKSSSLKSVKKDVVSTPIVEKQTNTTHFTPETPPTACSPSKMQKMENHAYPFQQAWDSSCHAPFNQRLASSTPDKTQQSSPIYAVYAQQPMNFNGYPQPMFSQPGQPVMYYTPTLMQHPDQLKNASKVQDEDTPKTVHFDPPVRDTDPETAALSPPGIANASPHYSVPSYGHYVVTPSSIQTHDSGIISGESPSPDCIRTRSGTPAPPEMASVPISEEARNQVHTLRYLIGEVKSVLGVSGDVKADRLFGDIESLVEQLSPVKVAMNFQTELNLVVQPLRSENSQLKRRLRITNQQLKERERIEKENQPDNVMESIHIEAQNASLMKQLQNEQNRNQELQDEICRMEDKERYLHAEKQRLLMEISQKDTSQMKTKHDWVQETTHLKKELEVAHTGIENLRSRVDELEQINHDLTTTINLRDTNMTRMQDLVQRYRGNLSSLLHEINMDANWMGDNMSLHKLARIAYANGECKKRFNPESDVLSTPTHHVTPISSPDNTYRLTKHAVEEFNKYNDQKKTGISPQSTPTIRPQTPGIPGIRKMSPQIERDGYDRVDGPIKPKQVSFEQEAASDSGTQMSERSTTETESSVTTSVSQQKAKNDSTPQNRFSKNYEPSPPKQESPNSNASRFSVTDYFQKYTPAPVNNGFQNSSSQYMSFHAPPQMNHLSTQGVANVQFMNAQNNSFLSNSYSGQSLQHMGQPLQHPGQLTHPGQSLQHSGQSLQLSYQNASPHHSYPQYAPSETDVTDVTDTSFDDGKSVTSECTITSVSSINSQDDRSFRDGLANLDANIARIQTALKRTVVR